jgi:hypothetical protein
MSGDHPDELMKPLAQGRESCQVVRTACPWTVIDGYENRRSSTDTSKKLNVIHDDDEH